MPAVGNTLDTQTLCSLALHENHLTPYRFEKAMIKLWEVEPNIPFEGRTGGAVRKGLSEKVVKMDATGYSWYHVDSGALTFGRSGPIRFIERVR